MALSAFSCVKRGPDGSPTSFLCLESHFVVRNSSPSIQPNLIMVVFLFPSLASLPTRDHQAGEEGTPHRRSKLLRGFGQFRLSSFVTRSLPAPGRESRRQEYLSVSSASGASPPCFEGARAPAERSQSASSGPRRPLVCDACHLRSSAACSPGGPGQTVASASHLLCPPPSSISTACHRHLPPGPHCRF